MNRHSASKKEVGEASGSVVKKSTLTERDSLLGTSSGHQPRVGFVQLSLGAKELPEVGGQEAKIGSELSEKSTSEGGNCCGCCCARNVVELSMSFEKEETSGRFERTQRGIKMSKSTRMLSAYFMAELVGTFLLVVIGDGAIAAYVLTKRDVDMFSACLAFGVGAMVATFAAARISGAHINPAATVAFALDGRLSWRLVPVYLVAQYLGGFLAALVLMVNYSEAIQALDGGTRSAFGSSNSTGNIFATYPGAWVSPWGALLDQIVGTAVLLFSLSAVSDKRNLNLEERHQPLYIALVIGTVCVSFNPNCGAIFNPARDLAPRLLTLLFGYKSAFEPTRGLYWLLAGVLGPHLGAVLGLFGYKLLIGSSLERRHEQEYDVSVGGARLQCAGSDHKPPPQQPQQLRRPCNLQEQM